MVQRFCIFLFSLLLTIAPAPVFGAMSSTNYTIYSDSIGLGGGNLTSTASYQISDTFADQIAGTVTNSTYELRGGYQAMEQGELTMAVNTNSVALGDLSASQVNSASVQITVTADALTGYTLSISNVTGQMPPDVQGGAVVAGTLAYGIAASGLHSAFVGDVPVAAGRVIASAPSPVLADVTTLTFKASMNGGSGPGDFSQLVTLSAVANF